MKIEIKNLGPISKFTFDVEKDLHLIYGKNSVGKSYAIYCAYILLKKFNDFDGIDVDLMSKVKPSFNSLYRKLLNIADKNEGKRVGVDKECTGAINFLFNEIFSGEITDSFKNTFSDLTNLKNLYSNKNTEIKITHDTSTVLLYYDKNDNISSKKFYFETPIEITKSKETEKYIIYSESVKGNSITLESSSYLIIALARKIDDLIIGVKSVLNQIYFLPSSRSGLYLALSSFAPIIAELSKHRFQLKSKIELPSISEPISDYFIPLANSNGKKVNRLFDNTIKQLEEDILQGLVSIDSESKRILFQPKSSSLKLDLSATSSMVSEIAPIVIYFKYIINLSKNSTHHAIDSLTIRLNQGEIKTQSIIFIEEPEAHLHPEIQVRLMEIFAELTEKHNMKIVLTSHSNYMFNKLVNMIIGKKLDVNKVVVNNMVMTKLGSVVDENMTVTEDGVDDFNFSETSEKLYEERMNIVD